MNKPLFPESELTRELALTEREWLVAAAYWQRRVSIAGQQRNTVLAALVVGFGHLVLRMVDLETAHSPSFVGFADVVFEWTVKVGIGLMILLLVTTQIYVTALNRRVEPQLPKNRIKRIVELGNQIAFHTFMFRKGTRW